MFIFYKLGKLFIIINVINCPVANQIMLRSFCSHKGNYGSDRCVIIAIVIAITITTTPTINCNTTIFIFTYINYLAFVNLKYLFNQGLNK